MEKRQLDFNAPLLSARRFSSPRNSSELVHRKVIEKRPPPGRQQSLPLNKYEWESEDITKPAAVPFHWEQIPGRPKNEAQTRYTTPHDPSNTPPRLPPGRLSGPSKYNPRERSNDQNLSFSDHASLLEKLEESLKFKDESNSESQEENEDAYSDALNTLSLTETCSVNGISGYHNSGMSCVDKQTRDFLMNRFLPAAKAVALETPAKKATVLNKEPKEVKKTIKPSIRKYGSDAIFPYYGHGFDNVESEDEVKECSVPVKKLGRSWICLKSSLCLLNPLPAMKSKSRTPTPSGGEERRLRRNAVSGPLDKNGCQVPPKKKYHSGLLSCDLPGLENKLNNDSYQLLNSRDSPRSGLSPLRRYRSGSISPYRNESQKSTFREGSGFLGMPKEVENFNASKITSSRKLFKALQDVSRTQINERGSSGPAADPVEKTVYVDSINKTAVPSSSYAVKSDKDEGKKTSSKYADEVRDIKLYLSLDRGPRAVECDGEGSDVKLGINEERKLGLLDNGGECDLPLKSHLPPPLPKSPSESWLWRTLPSIPLGNPFAHSRRNSQLHSKKQGRKGSGDDTKWETIVKSSNLRHDHARYSEELIPHASYRQRSYT